MPVDSVVAARNLCFKYDGAEILHGVTLTITAGDYIGLVGPNGSGKTTFIRTILGLLQPTHGSVALFGRDPSAFTGWGKIGYLPQKLTGFNPGFPALKTSFAWVGFKGGSEPGVLNLTFLLETKGDTPRTYVMSASWNNAAATVDEEKFYGLITRAAQLILKNEAK